MTRVALVVFDDFTDIDLFLAWDLLNRVEIPDWSVEIVGSKQTHRSTAGLEVTPRAGLETCRNADAVLFGSGRGSRKCMASRSFLDSFSLDPTRQLIGSQCSGALILAALGLLEGNVATAGGCLAAVYLASWVVDRLGGREQRDAILRSVAPVGQESALLDGVREVLGQARAAMD